MSTAVSEVLVRVNDQPRAFPAPITLQGALRDLGVAERRGVAVAVNDSVVPRAEWASRSLAGGERILVIQATQGG
jgi:sulfur carrier protein